MKYSHCHYFLLDVNLLAAELEGLAEDGGALLQGGALHRGRVQPRTQAQPTEGVIAGLLDGLGRLVPLYPNLGTIPVLN